MAMLYNKLHPLRTRLSPEKRIGYAFQRQVNEIFPDEGGRFLTLVNRHSGRDVHHLEDTDTFDLQVQHLVHSFLTTLPADTRLQFEALQDRYGDDASGATSQLVITTKEYITQCIAHDESRGRYVAAARLRRAFGVSVVEEEGPQGEAFRIRTTQELVEHLQGLDVATFTRRLLDITIGMARQLSREAHMTAARVKGDETRAAAFEAMMRLRTLEEALRLVAHYQRKYGTAGYVPFLAGVPEGASEDVTEPTKGYVRAVLVHVLHKMQHLYPGLLEHVVERMEQLDARAA